jgi:hypothetical protein
MCRRSVSVYAYKNKMLTLLAAIPCSNRKVALPWAIPYDPRDLFLSRTKSTCCLPSRCHCYVPGGLSSWSQVCQPFYECLWTSTRFSFFDALIELWDVFWWMPPYASVFPALPCSSSLGFRDPCRGWLPHAVHADLNCMFYPIAERVMLEKKWIECA